MFTMRRRDGYTLMELLTVIAIIAVLAGLIFPVAAGAKRKAKQAQCINNMYQIFTALKQFQLDEHRYPDFIAGPVQFDDGSGHITYTGTTIIPLEKNTGMMGGSTGGNGHLVALYPEYITTLSSLKCPFTDLNGDGNRKYSSGNPPTGDPPDIDIVKDPMYDVLKAKGVSDTLRVTGYNNNGEQFSLYKFSSYDYQKPPGLLPTDTGEVHYSICWEKGNDPNVAPGITRQLKWRTPPEETVVTWCSHHRSNQSNGTPLPSSKDVVLFLDGHVKQDASLAMETPHWYDGGWQAEP